MNVHLDYEPHHHQQLVHEACDPESPYLFVIVAAGRQSGKSRLCIMEAVKYALEIPDSIVWWVSPTDGQCVKALKDFVRLIRGSEIYHSHKTQRANAEVVLFNGSSIQFRSAASEANLRGATITSGLLIIDEAASIKKETIEEILLPMVNTTAKKIIMAGTPKGKNWFFDYWNKGQRDDDTDFISFHFTSEDNPLAEQRFIDIARREMNKNIFDQEFMAQWIDSASVFANINDCLLTNPPNAEFGQRYYLGIDVGMVNDYTCVSVFNSFGEMVFIDRFKSISNREIKERIKRTYWKYKPVKAFIEVNNQGLPIWSDLRYEEKLNNLEAFHTTGKSKDKIINDLIAAFNERRIKILNEDWLIKEFEAFIYKISDKGNIKFEAASGFHDDGVMATAICWSALGDFKHSGKYVYRTGTRL